MNYKLKIIVTPLKSEERKKAFLFSCAAYFKAEVIGLSRCHNNNQKKLTKENGFRT